MCKKRKSTKNVKNYKKIREEIEDLKELISLGKRNLKVQSYDMRCIKKRISVLKKIA